MELDKLRAALDESQQGLIEVDEQYNALREHKERLEKVVVSLRSLLEAEANEKTLIAFVGTKEERRPSTSNPTWWKVQRALEELKVPSTVPEIFEHMRQSGATTPAGDAIRIAILRKPDIFNKHGKARYGLAVWPNPYDPLEGQPQKEEATEVAPMVSLQAS